MQGQLLRRWDKAGAWPNNAARWLPSRGLGGVSATNLSVSLSLCSIRSPLPRRSKMPYGNHLTDGGRLTLLPTLTQHFFLLNHRVFCPEHVCLGIIRSTPSFLCWGAGSSLGFVSGGDLYPCTSSEATGTTASVRSVTVRQVRRRTTPLSVWDHTGE